MKRPALTLGIALLWLACSDASGPGAQPGVSLSFSTSRSASAAAPGFRAGSMADTLDDGSNELVLATVEIVLREIELKRMNHDDCDSTSVSDDSCEEFDAGPLLVNLPLDGAIETELTIDVPPDVYDEIEFDIHKVSNDDPEDADFRAQHPDMVRKSIRATGTYNGQPFTYETDLNVEQEHDLMPPLTIEEGATTANVTVFVDVGAWFVDGAGNLIDPMTANKGGSNEGLVKENIKRSVEAFEDDDRDGDDDE